MQSFHHSRGRIFFEVLCALAVSGSSAGAWMQTGASALLGLAGVALLYALVHAFDMRKRAPAGIAERVEAEPPHRIDVPAERQPDPPTRPAATVKPFKIDHIIAPVEPAEPVEAAKPPVEAAKPGWPVEPVEAEPAEPAEPVARPAAPATAGRAKATRKRRVSAAKKPKLSVPAALAEIEAAMAPAPAEPEAAAPEAPAAVEPPARERPQAAEPPPPAASEPVEPPAPAASEPVEPPAPAAPAEAQPTAPEAPAEADHIPLVPLFEPKPFVRLHRGFGRKAG